MSNYRGYFKSLDNKNYQVELITNTGTTGFTEIIMAASDPFIVDYDISSGPFDPVRTSQATINIVSDNYLFDIYNGNRKYCKVVLKDITNTASTITKWIGYLQPMMQDQGYEKKYETISLTASDCLSYLQYLDYECSNSYKSIVTFKQILEKICNATDLIGFFVSSSKRSLQNNVIEISDYQISEKNFFSSDTEEPWKLNEVLEELCKYAGYTAMEYNGILYLVDFQDLSNSNSFNGYAYWKSGYNKTSATIGWNVTINNQAMRGNGGQISYDSIYNKIKVNCSFYDAENFFPDIFDDKLLTNDYGDEWASKRLPIQMPDTPRYINKSGNSKYEEKPDSTYSFYHKLWNHKNYTSIWRNTSTFEIINSRVIDTYIISKDTEVGSTGVEYTLIVNFTNQSSEQHTVTFSIGIDANWWDSYHQMPDSDTVSTSTTFTISAGETVSKTLSCELDETGNPYAFSTTFQEAYKVDDGAWQTTDGEMDKPYTKYLGAQVVDIAQVESPVGLNGYNYEKIDSVTFDRYLMVPMYNAEGGMGYINPRNLQPSVIENCFPCIFKMNSGISVPISVDEDTYIAIDGGIIYERYYRPYINSDWTKELMGINGDYNIYYWGIISGEKSVTTLAPGMIFKLKIGNMYWDGSSWTSTNSCFIVDVSTPATSDNGIEYKDWYNTELHILNTFDWQEYSGAKGYRVPLNSQLDMSQPIEFQIHMPIKIQKYTGSNPHSGQNGFAWIKDLSVKIVKKGSEKANTADVVYENEISNTSINELNEIDLKMTSDAGKGVPSYSNVSINGGLGTKVKEQGRAAQLPEENIVTKYLNYYSTPTKKETITVVENIPPFCKVKDTYWNQNFLVLGSVFNYANGSQEITLSEIK